MTEGELIRAIKDGLTPVASNHPRFSSAIKASLSECGRAYLWEFVPGKVWLLPAQYMDEYDWGFAYRQPGKKELKIQRKYMEVVQGAV